ncbi:hypothetical protein [Corynebacterium ureicelerivorans]|uniref:hypothetical protein n=1 Tax=Corynebacterium ureicelerivorans TaxID=401472 RepID=UPI00204BC384|nr:hypothetical protein [Corynebacterium ureicelerivorans]DAI67967.1 MAG TPA: hypothetical protein [Caudoviricetes sp.]
MADETMNPGGEGVNPYNSLTRADTFGIRPDLFLKLSEITPSRPELDELMQQQEENTQKAEEIASDISGVVTKADFSEYDNALQSKLWGEQGEFNKITVEFQKQQKKIDAQQNEFLLKLQQVQQEAERRRPRPIFAKFSEYKTGYTDPEGFMKVTPYEVGDRGFRVDCLGSWTGEIIVRATAFGPLSANSIDSYRVPITTDRRNFYGTPEAAQMSYIALDMTVFPD